jgi:putative DNA primase/helicase
VSTQLQHEIAIGYALAGVSIIPLRVDGTKAPAIGSWNRYREDIALPDELHRWFGGSSRIGLGLVCGVVSGGLEVLDFDELPDETFHAWLELLPTELATTLCVCETGGLGYHVLYRCHEVCGNTKIAMTAEGGVLIESRGEGGYIVGVGSAIDVHKSGSPYVQVRGIPLPNLPTITPEQRKTLWTVAASFDDRPDPMAEYVRKRVSQLRPQQPRDNSTPWDDYDSRADWTAILQPAGWTTKDGEIWTRPGKTFGCSAKVVQSAGGDEVLTVFSGNAGPISPEGTGHRNVGKFAAYAALNHGGDRREAARAVRAMGYGSHGGPTK